MKKIGVIGIGNPLRQDDGIGIILINKLIENKYFFLNNVELIDAGTGGMNLLHIFSNFEKVLIIDAVKFGSKPGNFKIFKLEDIKNKNLEISFSAHETDFLKIIELSKKLNELPDVTIFGVQPKSTSHKTGLSKELSESVDKIFLGLNQAIKEIIK